MQIAFDLAPLLPVPASSPVAPPGPAEWPPVLPVLPAGRWHPGFSPTTQTADRLASAAGLVSAMAPGPGLNAGAEGLGPLMRTDALGRKFWRFTGEEYLDLAEGLSFSNRNISIFAVVRGGNGGIFSIGNRTGYGAGSTAVNGATAIPQAYSVASTAPYLQAYGRAASSDAAQGAKVVLGTQLQVAGVVSRTTANGGMRLSINDEAALVAQPSTSLSGIAGAEIGRSAWLPGSSGSWTRMDLYEMVVYDRGLSNAEAQAVATALMAQHSIAPITGQLVMDGDSISAGTGIPDFWQTPSFTATTPGAGHVPAGFRVFTAATSGNQLSHLVARRDTPASWATTLLPGAENHLSVEVGRNDFASGGKTAAEHYAAFLDYLNSPETGVLPRGWTVRVLVNIATGTGLMPQITAYRALLRDPQFLDDTQTAPGAIFAGKLRLIALDQISHGAAGTLFATSADAGNQTYYQPDSTHPNALGAWARLTGADTPQNGILAGLV